jgi:hypothetical protein
MYLPPVSAEQLTYCAKILSDLWRQQHWDVAHPFYEPVGTSIGTIVPCARFILTNDA